MYLKLWGFSCLGGEMIQFQWVGSLTVGIYWGLQFMILKSTVSSHIGARPAIYFGTHVPPAPNQISQVFNARQLLF